MRVKGATTYINRGFWLTLLFLVFQTNSIFAGSGDKDAPFDPAETAFHHIADANVYSIGPLQIPLPSILYSRDEKKWDMFMSSKFDFDTMGHGDGHKSYNGYVLKGGSVKRLKDPGQFKKGSFDIDGFTSKEIEVDGSKAYKDFVKINGQEVQILDSSKADGGLLGGGMTNFFNFSITKNVVSMILMSLFLGWVFIGVARAYKRRKNQAPKGLQNFIEPIFIFIQDEVAKPFLGHHWEKYLPFLMAAFFFIFGLNLFGQIPFLGGSNVTGALSVTMALALVTFLITNLSGNKHYWQHIFWMPGVPGWMKPLMAVVEFMGLLIKPMTLMLRLFANITAGHMVIIIFIGLIFIFGQNGANPAAAYGTSVGSILLTLFMMALELLVAFIQAFVFTILSASYIGAAIEDHNH